MHSRCPELQTVALRVLSLVASSSECERCWSIYEQIHSLRRNKLTAERAEKLVRLNMNLRLANNLGSVSLEERFMEWAVDGSDGASAAAGDGGEAAAL